MPTQVLNAKAHNHFADAAEVIFKRTLAMVPGATPVEDLKLAAPCVLAQNHHSGDEHNSFAAWIDPDGHLAWHCSAGCSWKALGGALNELGVPRADLHNWSGSTAASGASTTRRVRPAALPAPKVEPLGDQDKPAEHNAVLLSGSHEAELAQLMTRRGYSRGTVQRRCIGWDGQRYTFPVRLSGGGRWLNERRYSLRSKPKMLNIPEHGSVTWYGAEFLEANQLPVVITEGEPDAVLAQQMADEEDEPRFVAITHTGGAASTPKDCSPLAGRLVYVCFDVDDEGRRGALGLQEKLEAVGARVFILDLAALGLPEGDKSDNDFTDWVLKHGGTVDRLVAEMNRLGASDDSFETEVARRIEELRLRDEAQRRYAEQKAAERAMLYGRARKQDGAAFALDLPDETPCLWGDGRTVLMAAGEAMILAGGDGSGKTTLAQQLMLGMLGLGPGSGTFLNYTVRPLPAHQRVVYLAMDRPQQIARSLGRFVDEDDRAVLEERLWVWNGPLPIDVLAAPENLANWLADEFGGDVGLVVVDSYKDVVPGISEDKPGSQFNSAMQEVIARGIDWIGLHHQRKPTSDRKPDADITLHDVYGSRWLTAGAGSVLVIQGEAGARTVELVHVKQPDTPAPRILVHHDGAGGGAETASAALPAADVLAADPGVEMTLEQIGRAVYPAETASRAVDKRVDRELNAALKAGVTQLVRLKGKAGGTSPLPPRWVWQATS